MAAFLKDKEVVLLTQESVVKKQAMLVSGGTPENNRDLADSSSSNRVVLGIAILVLVVAVGVVVYRRYRKRGK
ncbi:hypothetical protein ABEW34_13690 [Paenibacillus algorifonticola]|uniref:hypothetical protein n=1 Tax=Paenibacillus algorifonticola TaxID=684063 RepID=UPI003D2A4EAD